MRNSYYAIRNALPNYTTFILSDVKIIHKIFETISVVIIHIIFIFKIRKHFSKGKYCHGKYQHN